MKRLVAMMLAFLLLLTSCATLALAQEQPPADDAYVIPEDLPQINVGFAMVCVWSSYAAKYTQSFLDEAMSRNWRVTLMDANLDAALQATQVENLIAQKSDIIVILPVDAKAIIPSVKKAYDAGIPVVIVNSNIDLPGQEYIKCFVGPDSYLQGEMIADLMNEKLGGQGTACVIRGTVGYDAADNRTNGFLDRVKDYPGIEVLSVDDCGWLRDKSQAIMENYIVKYGDKLNAVYGMDDSVAVGAINAINAQGLKGKYVVFGLGADADGMKAIKDGDMYVTVMQMPKEEVRAAFIAMDRITMGQDPDTKQIKMFMPVITADNVDEYEPAY